MAAATQHITVSISCADDSLFGGNTAGYDVAASMQRYAELVTEAIRAEYPDAEITTPFTPQMYGVRVTTPDDVNFGPVEDRIMDITTRIYEDGDWAVAQS